MFKVPEKYRVTTGSMKSGPGDGNNGCFVIPVGGKFNAFVIASNGQHWEHVSVHIAARKNLQKTPTWNQMCLIKDLFWDKEAVVMQLHQKASEYVNNHPHVLHLWRPTEASGLEIPSPPSNLVGIRNQRQVITSEDVETIVAGHKGKHVGHE